MKNFVKGIISAKEARAAELRTLIEGATDVAEARAAMTELEAVNSELVSARAQLTAIEAEEARSAQGNGKPFNAVATYAQQGAQQPEARSDDAYATMEYRTAFMNYVRTGERANALNVERRADDQTELANLGVLIPTTVVNEIIKGVEKKHGQLYSRVKKTNLKGGVKYPLGAFFATFNRIGENGAPTGRQDGGEITGAVEFGYKIGEVRLAKTLLMTVMGVDAFETELAKVLVEAYVAAMETEIVKGNPTNNEMCGILNNSADGLQRIPAENIIEMSAADVADWTAWEKKLFGQIPMAMEGENPVFVMAKQTYVGHLCTLKDQQGQPINKAGYDVTDRMHKFNEYEVVRVEKDIFNDFDSCADGEYFGMFSVLDKAYAINSNLNFAVTRYYDNEKNQWVEKGIVINDGKILDPTRIYLLKKKVVTA